MSYTQTQSYTYAVNEKTSLEDTGSSLYNLDFHLASSEIFSFLAIVFGVIEESLRESTGSVDYQLALVAELRKDLLKLQNSHHVAPRETAAA